MESNLTKARNSILSMAMELATITKEIIICSQKLSEGSGPQAISTKALVQADAKILLTHSGPFAEKVLTLKRHNVECDYAFNHEITLLEKTIAIHQRAVEILHDVTHVHALPNLRS